MPFGGLNVANSGMRVAQRNLNVTGHNIANAEVTGFSRQRITQHTHAQRTLGMSAGGASMQVGLGVAWSDVHQIRNEFLDVNFRNNVSQLQFYSAKVQVGTAIQTILGELHGAYNFQTAINEIWYSIQELTSRPEGLDTRQFFISTASSFLTKVHDSSAGLIEQQFNLDAQVREMVHGRNGINATVSAIANLNRQIRTIENMGDTANDLRDQRHLLVDHLATMIPIDVRECHRGYINITSLGHHIVSGSNQSTMGLRYIANDAPFVEVVFTRETEILAANTPRTEFTPFLNYSNPINPIFNNDRGRLMGVLQARGTSPVNRTSYDLMPPLTLEQIREQAALPEADRDPALLAQDNNRFISRYAATAPADMAALINEIQRDFDAQTHNHRAHMWSLEHAMIPQTQKTLDRIIHSITLMINDALTGNLRDSYGNLLFENSPVDARGNAGIPMFVREMDIRAYNAYMRNHVAGDPVTFCWIQQVYDNPEHPSVFETIFTAQNLRINPEFLYSDGHNNLALSLSGAPGDTDLLVALQEIWMSNSGPYSIAMTTLNTHGVQVVQNFNVQDAYIRMIGRLATETAEAASKVSSGTIKTDQAHSRRMSVKGVSMDEEMAAMLRFQFAFQAASRAFNVIDSMIDRLINGTGRVGL